MVTKFGDIVECILRGLRETVEDDDQLLRTASTVFDGLLGDSAGRVRKQ